MVAKHKPPLGPRGKWNAEFAKLLLPAKPSRKERRAKKKPKPGFVNYAKYIQSKGWKAISLAAMRRAGFRCERCGRSDTLSTRHKTYGRLGCELPADVEVLCKCCHDDTHVGDVLGVSPDAFLDAMLKRDRLA